MKLQIALDMLATDEALRLAELTHDIVDIIEIGTPLIKHEGLQVLKRLRGRFPTKEIMVDLKTMDVGEYESDFCFGEGADIVTVLGVADTQTIKGSVKSAARHGKKVMVDLINVPLKISKALEAEIIGCDYIGIHTGIDQQHNNQTPLEDMIKISQAIKTPIAVAGGINLETIDLIAAHHPAIIVVGGAITSSDDPATAAGDIKERMRDHERASMESSDKNRVKAA